MSEPTASEIRKLFKYDPLTGQLINRVSRRNRALKGDIAGTVKAGNYRTVFVSYRRYPAHRLIWLYVYGKWPDREIDHINGDKLDNRIMNLRLATRAENLWNTKRPASNTSGFKNVFWSKRDKRWFASVSVQGTRHYSTHFEDIEQAKAAARELRERFHGKFARA